MEVDIDTVIAFLEEKHKEHSEFWIAQNWIETGLGYETAIHDLKSHYKPDVTLAIVEVPFERPAE